MLQGGLPSTIGSTLVPMAIYDKSAGHDGLNTRGKTTGQTVVNARPFQTKHAKGTIIDPPAGKVAVHTMVWVQWTDDGAQENYPVRLLS